MPALGPEALRSRSTRGSKTETFRACIFDWEGATADSSWYEDHFPFGTPLHPALSSGHQIQ
jgi:hypothetical protein